jgi:RNA polymerase sigma-70 factor, ECF subfamily
MEKCGCTTGMAMHMEERLALPDTPQSPHEIYLAYHAQLLGFIKKKVPDMFAAEDILHDVFIKVQTKLHTLTDKGKIKSWLFQITRHAIADHYRYQKTPLVLTEHAAAGHDPQADDVYKRLQLSVLGMLQRLPLKYRQAMFLADYKGMTEREIATALHLTLPCVKSRVQRARKLMKEIYLKCCHFEFDCRGKITDYYPH